MKYDELDDKGKERAREWLRSLTFSDSSDWDHVYEDANTVAALFGLEINQREYKTMGGGKGYEPTIYFSGFSCQGDGACFEGSYSYKKGALKAVKEHAPADTKLHAIVKGLQDVQRRNFYRLTASTKQSGHYSHSGCMRVEVEDSENSYRNLGEDEGLIIQLMRDFADWIYKQLEAEHDYQMSDEQIEQTIEANEYDFLEDGQRERRA